MEQISNFVGMRADGKEVPSGMTATEMLALGWSPSKVLAVRWLHAGVPVEFAHADGVHAMVVSGGNFVAAIVSDDMNSRLIVLSADGSVHGELSNRLTVSGQVIEGYYGWFEPAMSPGKDKFGSIFQTEAGSSGIRCDIDASAPEVVAATPVR